MTRILLVASILVLATSCDKAKELAGGRGASRPSQPATNLAARPDILFQVFGEREDARIVPIAIVADGKLQSIVLDAFGWRMFDSLYTRGGNTLTLYRDGKQAGTLTVRQGMWERDDEALYTLPGCQSLIPMASVSIQSQQPLGYTVELLASTLVLGRPQAGRVNDPALARRHGRAALAAAGDDAGIEPSKIDSLQLSFAAVNTGATSRPTIVATAIDRSADVGAGTSRVSHVFAIADADSAGAYQVSYSHVASGSASTAEYRRYIDHLDITGDGVDEMMLEGWDAEGNTFVVLLQRSGTGWAEVFRGRSSWCLDQRR